MKLRELQYTIGEFVRIYDDSGRIYEGFHTRMPDDMLEREVELISCEFDIVDGKYRLFLRIRVK